MKQPKKIPFAPVLLGAVGWLLGVGWADRLAGQQLIVEPLPAAVGSVVTILAQTETSQPIAGLAIELGCGSDATPVFSSIGTTDRHGRLELKLPRAGAAAVRTRWQPAPAAPEVWLLTPFRVLPAPGSASLSYGWIAVRVAVGAALACWWFRRVLCRRAP